MPKESSFCNSANHERIFANGVAANFFFSALRARNDVVGSAFQLTGRQTKAQKEGGNGDQYSVTWQQPSALEFRAMQDHSEVARTANGGHIDDLETWSEAGALAVQRLFDLGSVGDACTCLRLEGHLAARDVLRMAGSIVIEPLSDVALDASWWPSLNNAEEATQKEVVTIDMVAGAGSAEYLGKVLVRQNVEVHGGHPDKGLLAAFRTTRPDQEPGLPPWAIQTWLFFHFGCSAWTLDTEYLHPQRPLRMESQSGTLSEMITAFEHKVGVELPPIRVCEVGVGCYDAKTRTALIDPS